MNDISHMLEGKALTTDAHPVRNYPDTIALVIESDSLKYTAFLTREQLRQIGEGIETYFANQLEEVLA